MDLSQLLINAKEPNQDPKKKQELVMTNETFSPEKPTAKQTKSSDNQTKTTKKSQKSIGISQELNEEIFMNILKAIHKENQESSMQYQKTRLSPTDLCGYCPRKVFFRYKNFDYELPLFYPFSELITHIGNAVHEWVQKQLAKVYKNVISEYKIDLPDYKLKGYIDLIYETDDNKTIILEIKTIGEELHDPKFYGKITHWRQLAYYYYIWTNLLGKKCDKVQLMYLKRDFKPTKINNEKVLPFKIFTVNDPKKLWDTYGKDLLWMYDTIKKAIETNEVPSIDSKRYQIIKKEECGFCPYQKVCSKYPLYDSKKIDDQIEFIF